MSPLYRTSSLFLRICSACLLPDLLQLQSKGDHLPQASRDGECGNLPSKRRKDTFVVVIILSGARDLPRATHDASRPRVRREDARTLAIAYVGAQKTPPWR